MNREENAIVLDYLKDGYPMDSRPSHRKTAIAQVIGTNFFSLLEVVPKNDCELELSEKVYMGEGKRDKIHHIISKLEFNKLTNTAKSILKSALKEIVESNEEKFVEFFNKSQPLSMRMHTIELLPGVGKKHMWEIVEERKGKPFTSFKDITERVKLMPNPEEAIIKRILVELEANEKHYLFVVQNRKPRENMR